MKTRFTLLHCCNFFAIILLLLGSYSLEAQTTNNQNVVTKCWAGPTQTFFFAPLPSLLTPINFVSGVDVPPGHKVVDVKVEVVWSYTNDLSCTGNTGALNLAEVGFAIAGPNNVTRYLAASSGTSTFPSIPTVNTFTGNSNVIRDTTVFSDGFPGTFPNAPVPGRDTIRPNSDSLNYFCGMDPYGAWKLGAILDAPPGGPDLCIHSYCITLTTCDYDTLEVSCKATPTVALNATTGIYNFTFADLDSISDVSCLTKSITFSPSNVNCSDIGVVPVTMTIRDHLDSVGSCVSMVNVVDNTPPVIPYCAMPFGTIHSTLYLDAMGRDTFWAADMLMTDNCGPITKLVRPVTGGPRRAFIPFYCVTVPQQFWIIGIDGNGNEDSCRVFISVLDTVAPTAVCGRDTVYVGNGAITMPAINVDGGSFDQCPQPISGRWIDVHFGPDPVYTCADVGSDTVSLIVSDASGNLDTCNNAVVTIIDNTPPTPVCQNVNVYLNAGGNATLLASSVDNGSVDTCGIDSIDINGLSSVDYDCSHLNAAQSVTLHVFDPSGNVDSCTATVTVLDTFPPTAICRNFTIYTNSSGVATLVADSLNNNSVDICTGNNLSFQIAGSQTAMFDCSDIATNPNVVTLTVLDSFGNSATCNSNVTVLDTIDPTPVCASPTVYLNNAGSATVTAAQLSGANSDNCSVANRYVNTIGLTSANYNCSAIFTPQAATLIVQDPSGNTASCNTTVNVVDTVDPTALCEASYTAVLNGSGQATVTPANIDSASTDNCGLVQYTINGVSSQTYTCADIGSNIATLRVRDSSNNIASCPTTINVVDNTPPVASCGVSTVYLNAVGTAAITPANILQFPATSDNCGIASSSFVGTSSPIVYDCDSIGIRTVRVRVTDASGNSATCVTTVDVQDTVAPNASCRPVPYTVQLDASGSGFVVPLNVNNNSSDVCGVDTMLVNGVDSFFYSCADIGNTAVTLQVYDASGNLSTCVANVVVSDPIAPTCSAHDTTLYLNSSGVVTAFPSYIDNGSTDNCPPPTLRINGLPSINYNCSNVGVNSAQLVVTDGGGNVTQCPANITVLDTFRPVAMCIPPATLNIYLDNTCFASVPASTFNNGSTDNCAGLTFRVGGLPNATFTNANLATNPNPVTLTVRDASGNSATCNTTVIVRDSTPPNMICRPDTVQLDALGNVTVLPSNINNGSTDNCSAPTLTINGGLFVSYNCSNIGSNNVTLTGQDNSGNAATCNTTVEVEDNIAPNASCNASVTVILDGSSTGTLTPANVDNGSTDNCTITSNILSQTLFDCGDIPGNPHTVTYLVTDQSGNADSCTTQVTVVDTVPPVANCIPGPLNLALTGSSVSITPSDINNGSTDNCAIESYALSQSVFTCSDIGSNSVILTVTDSSGNSGTCATTVNVSDNVNPTALCNSPTVTVDASGSVTVAATDLALPGSFDNCSIDTILANGADSVSFTCANLGPNLVTVFMSDPSGNTNTCPSIITVNDSVPPTASCLGGVALHLDVNGIGVLIPADIDNGSSDNCSISSMSISQDTFRCNDIATNPNNVVLTVTDVGGNTASCNSSVTVIDTIRPTLSCQPLTVNIHLSPGGVASVAADSFDNGTTDACGIASLTFNGAPSLVTCADIGVHPITLIAEDVNGNIDSCTTTLTVLDTVSPTLTCDTVTVNLDAVGMAIVTESTPGLYTMSDACGTPTLTLNGTDTLYYNCSDVGPNVVNLIATDGSGNSSSCNALVNIADVTPPSITCVGTTQYLDINGQLTVDPAWITAAASDACGISTSSTNPAVMDCSDIGPFNAVTLTVTDANGNQSSCNANIEVLDTIPPTMVCRDTTVCLSGGFVSVTAADIDGGTTDACGLSPIQSIDGVSNVIYTCADIGIQTAVLQMQDQEGNVDTCHAVVTVQDCVPPSAVCQNHTAQVGANGLVTVQAITLDFGSNDDCNIDSSQFKINGLDSMTFACSNVGTPVSVLFSVTDFSGNTDTCTSIITIEDNIDPVSRCRGTMSTPIVATLSAANGTFIIPAFNLNNTSTPSSDNCGISSYMINGQSSDTFTCAMIGIQTAVLTVTDNSGNTDTCHSIVNVRDITNPVIQCSTAVTNLSIDSTGSVSILASSLLLSSSDNCGIATITSNGQDTLTFDCSDVGGNIVVPIRATDFSGNQSGICNAIVRINDNITPVAICPTLPVPVYLTASGNVWVQPQDIDSASYDNCGIEFWQISTGGGALQDSLLRFCSHIGQFPPATLTIIDSSGAQTSCGVTLEVLDTLPPVAICSSKTITLSPQGVAYVNPFQIDSNSVDNCGQFNLSYLINGLQQDTFNCSHVGSVNIATLTVTDQYGNSSTCQSNINVVDNTNPNVTCKQNVNFYVGANGQVTVNPASLINTESDNCNIVNRFINGLVDSTFNCSQIGPNHQVQIRVVDQSGNSKVCNASLRILDTIPPTNNCVPNINLPIGPSGDTTLTGLDLSISNIDNCNITTYLINGQSQVTYNCSNVGATVATLTLIDPSGNQSTCTTNLNIVDNVDPTMICHDTLPIQLNAQGIAVVDAQQLDNGSFDNCGISTYLINGFPSDTFNCSNAGLLTQVTLTIIDANGNSNDCQVELDVMDNQAPNVICQNITAYLNSSGSVTVNANAINNGSTDNCGTPNISLLIGGADTTFTCVDTGVHTIQLVGTDFNGNSDTCTAIVTVRDTVAPIVACKGVGVNLTNVNTAVLLPVAVGPFSVLQGSVFDNCGGATVSVFPDTIRCTDIGDLIFTVTAMDASGNISTCQDTARVRLDQPVITQGDTVLCEGNALFLEGNDPGNGNNYDYIWSSSNSGRITFNPNNIDTTINVTVADEGYIIFTIDEPGSGGGCPASDSFYLDVNEVQPPVLFGAEPCDGDTTVINLTNAATYIGSSITYQWYFNGNPIAGNNFDSLVLANMTAADSGTYSMSITVTQGPSVCSDSSAVGFTIDILDLPAAPVPTVSLPCEGDTLMLFNNAPGFAYNWSGPNGFSSTDADPIRLNAVQAYAGLYSLTITDGNLCENTGTVTALISPTPPQPNLFYLQPLCIGDALILQDTSIYNNPPIQYLWEDPAGNVDTTSVGQLVVSNSVAGDYMLTVTMNGCPSAIGDTTTTVYEPRPGGMDDFYSIEFRDSLVGSLGSDGDIVMNDTLIPAGGFIVVIVDSTDGGTVRNNGDGTIKYVPRSGFFGTDTMYYALCDVNCPDICDTMRVLIEVTTDFECFIPQGISPNGDGINDQLFVRCRNPYPNAVMKVFSRWGTQVYEGPPTGWNGTFNGADLPDGTYFYILKLNDATFTGTGSDPSEGRNGDQYTGYIMLQR